MEPEELAVFVLECLRKAEESGANSILNRYNFALSGNLRRWADSDYDRLAKVLTEAWVWLEREVLIAPKPESNGDWIFVTRRGNSPKSPADWQTFRSSQHLRDADLDPVLAQKVKALFSRGDYDTAIFQAFKEVEIRVRKAARMPDASYGVDMIRKAFDPEMGPLQEPDRPNSERQALSHLFAGAIGLYKNPLSHRELGDYDPSEAAALIYFADHLLRIADRGAER